MHQRISSATRQRLSPLVTWGAVLLIAALACQPLLGAPPRGHDALLHYYRIPIVSELWQHGVLFSRWAPDLIYGYGSPLFNFYPPLSAYVLTALYWLLAQNGPLAYNVAFALALVLTTLSMFLLGRRLFGAPGGLLAAAAYTLAPHVLLQTYSRGSLSNAFALAFAPLAAFALLRVAQRVTARRVALAALATALMLLSHTASGLLFIPLLLLIGVAGARLLYRSAALPVVAALLLGLALSAFAWLPGLAEINVTRYAHSVQSGGAEFRDHFAVALSWPRQTITQLAKTPLPHSIGLVQLLQGAAAAVLAPLLLWRERSSSGGLARFLCLGGLAGLGVLFFAASPSAWFWQRIDLLQQVQFPWRLLDVPVLLLALATGWWATVLRPRWRPWLLGLALVLIFLNAVPYLYASRLVTLPQQPTLADATRVQQERGIIGLTAWGEYSSEEVTRWPGDPPFPGADRGASLHEKLRLPGHATLRAARGGLHYASWELFLPTPTAVSLFVHYFPGWKASLDGAPMPISSDDEGRMRLELPAGRHELTLTWTRTPVRRLADALSVLALAFTGALSLLSWRAGRSHRPPSPAARPQTPLWLPGLFVLFLIFKVAVFDATDTPLVVHPDARHVPGTTRPQHGDFGPIRLLGYEFRHPDRLSLYWYATRKIDAEYAVRLTATGADGIPVYEFENPHPGDNLTTGWGPGLVVRDNYDLPLEEFATPGVYHLSVSLLEPRSGEPLPVLDGPPGATTVGVGDRKRAPQPVFVPSTAQSLDATFAGALSLDAVQIPDTLAAGEQLPLTLYWHSLAPVAESYTVFVHLLDAGGEFLTAYDAPPLDGLYPTHFWEPGETIVDARRLNLDVPPGQYFLKVGLYEPQSGERLPLDEPRADATDNVLIGPIAVHP